MSAVPAVMSNFNLLPVELKHEVLKRLKICVLEDVCTQVCSEWEEIVVDILDQMRLKPKVSLTDFSRTEMVLQMGRKALNDPLAMIKYYENCVLKEEYGAASVEVNESVADSKCGLMYKLWGMRGDCECRAEKMECILRRVHVIQSFNLLVIDSDSDDGALKFYHLSDLEKLNRNPNSEIPETFTPYHCEYLTEWIGNEHTTNTGISVFNDRIVVGIKARTILLLRLISVDHGQRQVNIERVRIIHLPLWTAGLCLFETSFLVLYTTGHVGKWDENGLYISEDICNLGHSNPNLIHITKLYRLGDILLVKTNPTGKGRQRWYAVDSKTYSLKIQAIDMRPFIRTLPIDSCYLEDVTDVLHLGLWCNCFFIQFNGIFTTAAGTERKEESHLAFFRIQGYPTVTDFMEQDAFHNFLSLNANKALVSVRAEYRIAFTSAFIPASLSAIELDPPAGEPVPVADLVAVQQTPKDRSRRNPKSYVKVFRIRLANLPRSSGD